MTSRIWSLSAEIRDLLNAARAGQQRVVLVSGVFDLLHAEHRHFLQKAKASGDVLLVGIESDARVRRLKGDDRPVWDEKRRKLAIEELPFVDGVFILPEEFSQPEDHRALIELIRPQVLAVSSHTPHLEPKRKLLAEFGGEVVVVLQQNPSISTTQLIGNNATLA